MHQTRVVVRVVVVVAVVARLEEGSTQPKLAATFERSIDRVSRDCVAGGRNGGRGLVSANRVGEEKRGSLGWGIRTLLDVLLVICPGQLLFKSNHQNTQKLRLWEHYVHIFMCVSLKNDREVGRAEYGL